MQKLGTIFWYVLFVKTGHEEKLLVKLMSELDSSMFSPFIPKKAQIFRRQGQKTLFHKICFPGYLFIESVLPPAEFLARIFPILHASRNIYRFVNYGDRSDIAMKEDERIALSNLLNANRCIDISTGFKEGDKIQIISGVLAGNESRIVKINKNKNYAIIALEIFGSVVELSISIDIIKKDQEV